MIKPESNAPSPMKPWVRVTDNQLTKLETRIAKVENTINGGNASIDYKQNQNLNNTFSFTSLDDGSTVTNAGSMNFTAPVTTEGKLSIAGSLIVGDPSRKDYDPTTGLPIASIPNLEIIAGWQEVNPVTETEYYTSGQLNTTDTFLNMDAYGIIHGDGLQIVLANDGQTERQNIAILGVVGDGTNATYQIENNASNVATYTAGKYVNITGVIPSDYNGANLLITSVNTGVSPMTFTILNTSTTAYTSGGYVTINQANSIYEGKLSVQGPSPDYYGVTVEQDGVYLGSNGGDPSLATTKLELAGVTAPSAFVDQAVINGTRLFISSTPPTAVNDGDIWIDKAGVFTGGGSGGGSGTVTSVGMSVPTGLSVTPSSITTSGTFAVSLTSGYSIPTTASQTNWDTAYTDRNKWDGGSTGLVAATGRSSLGGTTVGQNFFTLANPTAITFPRINADNTVSALDAATFRTAIGAAGGYGYIGDSQTTAAAGGLLSITGLNGFTSVGGSTLTIGSTAAGGVSGNVFLQSGATGVPNSSTGVVTVKSGDAYSIANSGAISIFSGLAGTSAGSSGNVYLNVGSIQGTGSTGGIGIGNATLTNTSAPSVINIGPASNTTLPINISGAVTMTAVPTLPAANAIQFFAGPSTGSTGIPSFRYITTNDFTQSSSPSLGQALVAAPVTGGWSWGGPYLALTGGTLSGNLTLAAPTSTLSSTTFTTGTQPTLASQAFGQVAAGAESLGLGTTKTTGAGPGFGIIKAPQMVFSLADAPVAASTTTGVAAFATANDVLSSLEANKLYQFRGKYYVTYTAGGTAAALQLLFAFANTPQAIKYSFRTTKSTSATAFDQVGIGAVATGVSVSTSTQTNGTFVVEFDGYFTSNATTGGTLTPQVAASASSSGGSFFVTTGSWFEIQKIGTATQTLISGNWA
jgi:hypothetical protein